MKSILFRIPDAMKFDLQVELEFENRDGQHFVENLVWERIGEKKSATERNSRGESRASIRSRLEARHGSHEARDKKGSGEKSVSKGKRVRTKCRTKTQGRSGSDTDPARSAKSA